MEEREVSSTILPVLYMCWKDMWAEWQLTFTHSRHCYWFPYLAFKSGKCLSSYKKATGRECIDRRKQWKEHNLRLENDGEIFWSEPFIMACAFIFLELINHLLYTYTPLPFFNLHSAFALWKWSQCLIASWERATWVKSDPKAVIYPICPRLRSDFCMASSKMLWFGNHCGRFVHLTHGNRRYLEIYWILYRYQHVIHSISVAISWWRRQEKR